MKHPLSPLCSTNLTILFHNLPSRDWFGNALRSLGRFYRFVPLSGVEEYFSGGARFNSCCHVTFDDGDASFYRDGFPVLRDMGVPATLFISPRTIIDRSHYWFQELAICSRHVAPVDIRTAMSDVLGWPADRIQTFSVMSLFLCMPIADIHRVLEALKARYHVSLTESPNMTVDQVREVARSGLVTIGAHSMDHPVLGNETDARAREEIERSVVEVSRMIDAPVAAFAYPNGTETIDFGAREQHVLRGAGVRLAFSTDPGFFGAATNPLAIPRGGCPRLEGEPEFRTAARLVLLPALAWLNRQAFAGRRSEPAERRAIRRELQGISREIPLVPARESHPAGLAEDAKGHDARPR